MKRASTLRSPSKARSVLGAIGPRSRAVTRPFVPQPPAKARDVMAGLTVERFAASIEPESMYAALNSTGTASMRRRKFPAETAVWLVIGMALFADRSIAGVVFHLGLALEAETLAQSAVSQARSRLGAEPIEALFRMTSRAWRDRLDTDRYRGLALFAIDGSFLKLQDSDENYEYFGKARGANGEAGYPQTHVACLLELSQRMMVEANFGPFLKSELALAEPLLEQIPRDTLTLLDRGFNSYPLLAALLDEARNRHFMVRLRADVKPEMICQLPDGSWRARWHPDKPVRREHPNIRPEILGRVIEYQHPGGEKSRVFTTLVDENNYAADELVELYHDRWEIELAFDELKTHMLERKESLRSKKPDGVRQELWGIFLAYNLVRFEMARAAEQFKVAPYRMSFRHSLMLIRIFFLRTAWIAPPTKLSIRLAEVRDQLGLLTLPERRSKRRYERHVKVTHSRYKRNRGTRAAPQPGVDVAKVK